MNRLLPLLLLSALLGGCRYAAPLAAPGGLPVDAAVTGHWRQVAGAGGKSPARERGAVILAFTGNDYLIHYRVGNKALYLHGYPVRIAGRNLVQLQLIGTGDGPVPPADRKYDVAAWSLDGGRLRVSLLNGDVVSTKIGGREALRRAFRAHADDPHLFRDFGTFRRVSGKQ